MSHVKEYLCHLFDLFGQIDKPTISTHAKRKDILIYLVAINALSVILNGLYYITALKTKPKKDYRQLVGTLFRK